MTLFYCTRSPVFQRATAPRLTAGAVYHVVDDPPQKRESSFIGVNDSHIAHLRGSFSINIPKVGSCFGYHVCVAFFTSPALVLSPEVNADQRRGALVFPAGLRRAAGGDALRSHHLQPLRVLLLVQRDGVPVESQISHAAWTQEGDTDVLSRRQHTPDFVSDWKVRCANFQIFILYSGRV